MKEKNEAFENIEKELGRLKAETDKIDATLKLLEMCREQRKLIGELADCLGDFLTAVTLGLKPKGKDLEDFRNSKLVQRICNVLIIANAMEGGK